MSSKYLDRYYNHFSKSRREDHNPLAKDKNYLMRFNTFLPYSYARQQNSLSLVYSNSLSPMNLVTKERSSKLKKGHFTIINPNTDWEFLCKEEERIDVLSFVLSEKLISKFSHCIHTKETKLLEAPFEVSNYDDLFIENTYKASYSETGKFMKNLLKISNSEDYELLEPNEIVLELLGVLYQEQSNYHKRIKLIKGKKEGTKREVFKRTLVAHDYLHDSYQSKNIDIEELSLISGLSEYHLYSSFKAIYQQTPHQYLNRLRMQKAKQLINSGKMTISEISDTLQFPDLPTFSKLFKKTYGITPSKLIYSI
ncbi:AraC family transcriptional regulator [uncultured Aquimarina sp.]|uniref:AraC family transcriptional regulator n=1 Tax=uncultured Aquimarina sp. TaxID=575652 RepID=UPI00263565B8|nr:AraC family transcriptional regulator [uncultured Aquimarina sp.]